MVEALQANHRQAAALHVIRPMQKSIEKWEI